MIHVWPGSVDEQLKQAFEDLDRLQGYVDGVIVENYGWGGGVGNNASEHAVVKIHEVTKQVVQKSCVPVGVNLLPNDYEHAIGICALTGAKFVQLDHVTGYFQGTQPVDPVALLKARTIDESVVVLGGIHPKYYQLTDPQVRIADSAKLAMQLCDAIVVTGNATGDPVSHDDLLRVHQAIGDFPILIGSGLTAENAVDQFKYADGAIVGTAFKRKGVQPGEPIDPDRVVELIIKVRRFRTAVTETIG